MKDISVFEKQVQHSFSAGPLTRRSFLKGSATLGIGIASAGLIADVLTACGTVPPKASSGVLTPVSVQLNWLENVEFAGILWAISKGYYKANGLSVSVAPLGTTTDPVALVAGGTSLVGMVSEGAQLIVARSKGIPIKAFAADMQTLPSCWMTLKSSGITTMQDLKGKVVGIQESARPQLGAVLALGGLSVHDVTVQLVGYDSTVLVDHQVDAFSAFSTNEPITLQMQGIPVNVIMWADYGYKFYADPFFATDNTILHKKEVLQAFVKATRKGWAEVLAHRNQAVSYVVDQYGHGSYNSTQQLKELDTQVPLMKSHETSTHGLLAMSMAQWQTGINIYQKYGLVPPGLHASDVATEAIAG